MSDSSRKTVLLVTAGNGRLSGDVPDRYRGTYRDYRGLVSCDMFSYLGWDVFGEVFDQVADEY